MRENETKNFWLQMTNDFYDSDRMLYLESQPDGRAYCLLYTKLLLKSIRTGGVLRLSEKLAYTDELIAGFTRMPPEIIRKGLQLLESLDLLERWEDGTLFLPEIKDMVGSETKWAGYKRKAREKEKAEELEIVQSESKETADEIGNFPINKRKENNSKTNDIKEEDIKETAPGALSHSRSSVKSDVKKSYGGYGWIELTNTEYSELLRELGEAELVRCISYIDESAQSTGNRNHWQDWALILRRCSRERWGVSRGGYSRQSGDYEQPESSRDYDYSEDGMSEGMRDLERMRAYLRKLKGEEEKPHDREGRGAEEY